MNTLKKAEQSRQAEGKQGEPSTAAVERNDSSVESSAQEEIHTDIASETPEKPDIEDTDEINLSLDEVIVDSEPMYEQAGESPAVELALEAEASTEVTKEKGTDIQSTISQADEVAQNGLHKTVVVNSAPVSEPYQAGKKFASKSRWPLAGNPKMWLPVASVFLLLLLGAGGYYYFSNVMSEMSGSAVMVAHMPAANGFDKETGSADASPTDQNDTQLIQATTQPTAQDNIVVAIPTDQDGTQLKQTTQAIEQDNIVATKQLIKQNMDEKLAIAPVVVEKYAPVRMAAENQYKVVADKTIVEKPRISIVRRQKVDPEDQLLNSAYQAYKAGNYTQAVKGYQAVLMKDGSNRDALLGLAVIAHRNNKHELASSYYISLLKLNPRDSVAVSGLIALQSGSLPAGNESRIKLLLDQEPEAAHLHFTLGTLYASQSRWADAQQSFFNAHRYDPQNSDYAYNLAVSLDRIGQQDAALNYYQLALELVKSNQVMFNQSKVNERIKTLVNLKTSPQ